MLNQKLQAYAEIQDNVLRHLTYGKQINHLNDLMKNVNDKFVESNNAANWAAEEIFQSPEAQIYVDKLNQTLPSKK